MRVLTRATSHASAALGNESCGSDQGAREIADSIAEVGLLRPLVIDAAGAIVDGAKRARALRMLGYSEAPAIRVDLPPEDVTQAAALRTCFRSRGLSAPAFVGASRATLDRVEKVFAVAEDPTLPVQVRAIAAEGVAQIAAGESANGVLSRVTAALNDRKTTSRYPELAHLPHADALRMAAYLDQVDDPAARELELSVLRLTAPDPHADGRALSMHVYTHLQDLAHVVDAERANAVAAALTDAIAGSALTPALLDRCIDVAAQLERTAACIRTAVTLDLEHA